MLLVHSCSVAGMMDTVLNLGLNDITVEALAKKSGDRRFAFDSYRRFVQMYSDVVLGIEINHFEKHLERAKEKRGVKQENLIIVVTMLCFEYVVLFLLLSAKLLIGICSFPALTTLYHCLSFSPSENDASAGLRAASRGLGKAGQVLQSRGPVGAWRGVPRGSESTALGSRWCSLQFLDESACKDLQASSHCQRESKGRS